MVSATITRPPVQCGPLPEGRATTSWRPRTATCGPTATPRTPGCGPSIQLLATPGHTDEASTLVATGLGLVVLTHLWWSSEGPADDPFARDRDLLRASREAVLALGPTLIVPGHGAPFAPTPSLVT